jgi:predicted site-specific integrase-resolvase
MDTMPQMLDEKQVARALAVSVAALRKWRREGRGPEFAHLERCVRYPVNAIERFLTKNSSGNKRIRPQQPSASPKENV